MSALEGKVAIVSGAAQGLGEAFARALSEQGAVVTAFDVQETIGDVAAAIEKATGNRVLGVVAVVTGASLAGRGGRWRLAQAAITSAA